MSTHGKKKNILEPYIIVIIFMTSVSSVQIHVP